jgi:hypothetical protein
MELNLANLGVHLLTVVDKTMPLLANVHIASDGSTIGANSETIIAVAPMSSNVKQGEELTISTETIMDIVKAMPKIGKYKDLIDLVEVERVGNKVQFAFTDGKNQRIIEAKEYTHEYINYKELYERELNKNSLHRVILNKKRLYALLNTIEKLVPEKSGEFPIFAEFTDTSLVLRLSHPKTGQRIIAIMLLSTTEKWLALDKWEEKLKGEVPIPVELKPLQRVRPAAIGTCLRRIAK